MRKKSMEARTVLCYMLLLLGMFFAVIRVVTVSLSPEYAQAAESESAKRMVLGGKRGSIFDCHLNRLTNQTERFVLLISDHPAAITAVSEQFSGDELQTLLEEIKQNGLAVRTSPRELPVEGIVSVPIRVNEDENMSAKHILGYTDAENHGVCGLQAAFDSELFSEEQAEVSFITDGHGNILPGERMTVHNPSEVENSGVAITIDSDIQGVAEQAAQAIDCGAVVITEAETGKIRAMVSRPDYSLQNLSAALTDENAPLLNRALCAYNVGSVFKPCVAAAALENHTQDFSYTCIGYADIDGLIFRCHKLSGHGEVDLPSAIKYSCNTFFYNFAAQVGADPIVQMARRAGFSDSVMLADGIRTASGNIGNLEELRESRRALANLAIGQGELMLSPVGITTLYMAIASDGCYHTPSLIEGRVRDGALVEAEPPTVSVRLMKETNARLLREYLADVLEEDGTGTAAKPETVTAGGKTATAQTGIIKNGRKVINSWFCGFFPLENPRYVVTVLSEDAAGSCAAVFARIADGVAALEQSPSED